MKSQVLHILCDVIFFPALCSRKFYGPTKHLTEADYQVSVSMGFVNVTHLLLAMDLDNHEEGSLRSLYVQDDCVSSSG